MSDVVDVEEVTIWATIPSTNQRSPLHNGLVSKAERSQQAQYSCVLKGSMRFYLASFYQSLALAPKANELKHPWSSRHVSQQDLRDRVDLSRNARPLEDTDVNVLTIDTYEGQCLYIPAGWWYQIEASDEETTLTVTHWYDISSTWVELIFNGIEQNKL